MTGEPAARTVAALFSGTGAALDAVEAVRLRVRVTRRLGVKT